MRKYYVFLIFSLLFLASFVETPPKKWLALGDSITYLNDHQNETQNRISKGYMTLVCENRQDINYINKGFNGLTAQRVSRKIGELGLEKAAIYSVFLGTNDWWAGIKIGNIDDYLNNSGSETFYGSYRIIIDKLKSLNPEATIILITPMLRGDFVYINDFKNNAFGSYQSKNGQELQQFADAINSISKLENFNLVDLFHHPKLKMKNLVKYKRLKNLETQFYHNVKYPKYKSSPFDPNKDEYPYPIDSQDMTFDGLHPSDKGYQVIADLFLKVLVKA